MPESLIFDIKRYAINDGPGIRIVVFFKGCNLQCAWCHNPEGISHKAEIMYANTKCIKCGSCKAVCPENAISLHSAGIEINPELCNLCGTCVNGCPAKALEISGTLMTVTEIMDIIEKEQVFFEQSGGGVTFSGGEPLLHSEILIELLDECGKRGIHRAVDTAGNVNTAILLNIAFRTDLFLYDIKMMDSGIHKNWTKSGNELILRNLVALVETGANIIIRIPLIGGVNDTMANIEQTAGFIAGLPGKIKEVHLLPYHAIAENKHLKLGKPESFRKLQEPEKETQNQAIAIFARFGILASIGG